MPYAEDLRSLAEIAVALAGFTGIVVALEGRSSPLLAGDRRARLRELLLASLGVVFFAFLPTLLAGATGDQGSAWRASQLVLAVYHLLLMVIFFRSTGIRAFARSEWLALPPATAVVALQLTTGLGFFPEQLEVAYLLALLWFLFIAGLNFVLLLLHEEDAA